MTDIVIHAEGIGKAYTIGHREEIGGGYIALRDVMVQNVTNFWHKTKDLVQGKPIIQGTTQEQFWALKDVSFEVKRGEAVGIIGRNGAGKSTLLKILSRITEPSAGRATIKGRVASLLEVGTGFHTELTGRENIYLNGSILGMTRVEIKHKFDEIVAFSGVERFLDTPVKRYSSGMYVRLAFAVAAHLEPEILVIDEVLAVGDAEFQKKCLGKMGEVASEGRTVLFVSHNMAAVLALCGRGMLLSNGQISSKGNIENVVNSYLFHSNQMNQPSYQFVPNEHELANGFYFKELSILRAGSNQLCSDIPITEGFDAKIKYELSRPIKGFNVCFHLTDVHGTPILTTTDVDTDLEKLSNERPVGSYTSCLHIKNDFLRPGQYMIGVSASIPNILVLGDYRHLFSINVLDTGSPEGIIQQKREGVIFPLIYWNTFFNEKY